MTVSRAVRGWGQLALQVLLLLVALGLLQVVLERTNRRFDLTPTRSLSLSPVTEKLLAEVREPLHLTVFHRRGERQMYAGLLDRLRAANPRVGFTLYDLDRYPERARGLGVKEYGRAAIDYAGHRIVVGALPEAELAGGILRVLRGQPRRVVFSTGHGERVPGGDAESYGRLAQALEAENYAIDAHAFLDGPAAPETDLVVVAGPRHDFLPHELNALGQHLERGGGLLVLLDPGPLPNLSRFLAALGIRLGDDFIVDRGQRVLGTDGLVAMVELFKRDNPVSDAAANPIRSGVVLPSARTVDVIGEGGAQSIARTSPSTWVMADLGRARRGEEPSAAHRDAPGAASVVVMAEVQAAGNGHGSRAGRLVVVGDADFASDAYLDLLGNRDLALSAVAWTAGEAVLTGARPGDDSHVQGPLSPLVLTEAQARTIFLAGVVVEPGLVLLGGLAMVGLRRRRG
jgi:hypothetical protein